MKNIPEKINLFNMYQGGNKLIGLTEEVTLPDFEAISETISGPGILGEIDSPTPGHFGSLELEVPFRVLCEDIFSVMAVLTNVDLTLRAASQESTVDGAVAFKGMRIVVRGKIKKFAPGSMKQGAAMKASATLELTYIKIEYDGVVKLELDKLAPKYVVNGVDILAEALKLC
jgi:P2 family phage contractile tail tube protein